MKKGSDKEIEISEELSNIPIEEFAELPENIEGEVTDLEFKGINHIQLTPEILKNIYPNVTISRIFKYIDYLNVYINEYEINTEVRLQMFLAQIGHESGQLRYVEELASGEAYEMRKDLGNIYRGDGVKFKGRGLIQITGRYNYTEISKDLRYDFVNDPKALSEPQWAVKSACWFWQKRNLNAVADTHDFRRVTRIINGGYNGMEDRLRLYELCKKHIQYA